jgi:uncharacterized protein (DUF1330 family)
VAKAYWVVCYRSIKSADKLADYAKIAAPVVQAAGGRFLVRAAAPQQAHEAGLKQRTVVTEFDSLATAVALYQSAAYQEAVRALGDGAERDFRIVEGVA